MERQFLPRCSVTYVILCIAVAGSAWWLCPSSRAAKDHLISDLAGGVLDCRSEASAASEASEASDIADQSDDLTTLAMPHLPIISFLAEAKTSLILETDPTEDELQSLANQVSRLWMDNHFNPQFQTTSPISAAILKEYAYTCLKGYNDVGYHHARHAVDVFEFVVRVFWKNDKWDGLSKEVTALAALCHDLGHPGFNNKAVYFFPQIEGKVNEYERSGLEKIRNIYAPGAEYEHQNVNLIQSPEGARKLGGTFCDLPLCPIGLDSHNQYHTRRKCPILPDRAFDWCFAKGCGRKGGEWDCSSLMETYHAFNAVRILKEVAQGQGTDNALLGKYSEQIYSTIMQTDFGKDYFQRKQVKMLLLYDTSDVFWPQRAWSQQKQSFHRHPKKTPELAGGLVIHIADINAACKPNFLWWSAGVIAEFTREGLIGLSVKNEFLSSFPFTVHDFANAQMKWGLGVLSWFQAGIVDLQIGDPDLPDHSHIMQLEKNIDLYQRCLATVDKASLVLPEDYDQYEVFKELWTAKQQQQNEATDMQRDADQKLKALTKRHVDDETRIEMLKSGSEHMYDKAATDLQRIVEPLLRSTHWTQVPLRDAIIKTVLAKCSWDESIGAAPILSSSKTSIWQYPANKAANKAVKKAESCAFQPATQACFLSVLSLLLQAIVA